jgi:hypothetical protein
MQSNAGRRLPPAVGYFTSFRRSLHLIPFKDEAAAKSIGIMSERN